ncbi:hypothetical protein [Holospora elegans]|uniref:hypothetical protein n=1 Tax=Holospora elegans TaxID=431043 RepID=UPI000557575A|nr:hypothetical protein [Holospora elegans]
MKTQGVNLENTPMKDLGRVSKLDDCRYCYFIRFYNEPYTRTQGDSGGSKINSYSLISAIF